MPICRVCNSTFPNWIRVDGTRRNVSSRRACPSCIQFKAGFRVERITPRPRYTACALCDKPNVNNRRRRCGACSTKIRRFRAKLVAIRLMGSTCSCGYSLRGDYANMAAFEFHHLRDKDFNFGNIANRSWTVIEAELRKCVLICSNCHRIEHSSRDESRFVEEAERYTGQLFALG
jgi:hypothetical protein